MELKNMSEINNLNVLFRFANENDYNYILKTIMKSIRYEPIYKEIRDVIYYKNIEAKIKKDLSTHNIILCVDKNEYTLQTYLQKTANVIVVHKTAFVRSLENRYNLIYNPFIFFENK